MTVARRAYDIIAATGDEGISHAELARRMQFKHKEQVYPMLATMENLGLLIWTDEQRKIHAFKVVEDTTWWQKVKKYFKSEQDKTDELDD